MANVKISALNAQTASLLADEDLFVVVDLSENETKRLSFGVLKENAIDPIVSNVANLQVGLAGANANIYATYSNLTANIYSTYNTLDANIYVTYDTLNSNIYATYDTLHSNAVEIATSIALKSNLYSNGYYVVLQEDGNVDFPAGVIESNINYFGLVGESVYIHNYAGNSYIRVTENNVIIESNNAIWNFNGTQGLLSFPNDNLVINTGNGFHNYLDSYSSDHIRTLYDNNEKAIGWWIQEDQNDQHSSIVFNKDNTRNIVIDINGNLWTYGANAFFSLPGGTVFDDISNNKSVLLAPPNSTIEISGINTGFRASNTNAVIYTDSGDWVFDNNATLTLPGSNQNSKISFSNSSNVYLEQDNGQLLAYTSANKDFIITTDEGSNTWIFGSNGSITLPEDSTLGKIDNNIVGFTITPNSDFVITTSNGTTSTWSFNNNASLELPKGGSILEGTATANGNTVDTIELTPNGGGNPDQRLVIYPTATEGNHIHITSGNQSVTDLYLGNDDQYFKVSADGNNTIGITSNTWVFDNTGILSFPNANLTIGYQLNSELVLASQNTSLNLVSQGASGNSIVQWVSDLSNLSTSNVAGLYINNPSTPYGSLSVSVGNNSANLNNWIFNTDGTTIFPNLIVNLHNGGNQQGQVLKFGDSNQQAIITGPTPAFNSNAQRLVIQGQRGEGVGEGGDVYLWAGDSDVNGGDIKIYAGDADNVSTGSGGYINIAAGTGYNQGGHLTLHAGSSTESGGIVTVVAGSATNGVNGYVRISTVAGDWDFKPNGNIALPPSGSIAPVSGYMTLGQGLLVGQDGNLFNANGNTWSLHGGLNTPSSSITLPSDSDISANVPLNISSLSNVEITSNGTWTFGTDGTFTLPTGGSILEGTATANGNTVDTIELVPNGGADVNQKLVIYPTATEGNHIHITSGDQSVTDLYLGNDDQYFKVSADGNNVIGTGSNVWVYDKEGTIHLPDNGSIKTSNGDLNIESKTGYVNITSIGSTFTFDNHIGRLIMPEGGTITGANGSNVTIESPTGNFTFSSGGVLSIPGTLTGINNNITIISPTGNYTFNSDGVFSIPGPLSAENNSNVTILSPTGNYIFGSDGSLAIPGVITGSNGSNVVIVSPAGNYTFGSGGSLSLPGANVSIGSSQNGDGIIGALNTQLTILSSGTGSSSLEWQDNPTDLSNSSVSKITSNGSISILTGNNASNTHNWVFDSSGSIIFPNSDIQGNAFTQSYVTNVASNITNLQIGLVGTNTAVYNITHSPVMFESDVSVRGNLYLLSSNATIITANSISTDDSLIYLAANNTVADIVDVGFFAHYYNGSNSHTGLIRSAITKDYYLFQEYDKEEPDNSIDIYDASFKLANLRVQIANASLVYSSGVELRANDYATLQAARSNDYATLTAAYSNDYTTLLAAYANDRATLLAAYANDSASISSSYSNDYTTLLSAYANDGITLSTARANDYATLQAARSNDWSTLLTARANDYTTLQSAYSNDWSTLVTARANDYATLQSARSNDYTTLQAAYSNDGSTLQTARANDYATLQSARSNDYTTLQAAYSNDYSTYSTLNSKTVNLQIGLSGSNTNIINLQSGLNATNTAVAAITSNNVSFQKDVTIQGNLTVLGNTGYLTTNTVSTGDTFFALANNNKQTDIVDIGLYGTFYDGSSNNHTGLFRSAVSKDWMLFKGYTPSIYTNSTINIGVASFALANLRLATANVQTLLVNGSNIITTINSEVAALRANDYATYTTLSSSFSSTYSNVINLQTGLSGSNTNISNLQVGLSGANTNILNVSTGLDGTNALVYTNSSNISNLQTGLVGSNTIISNLQVELGNTNSNVTSLQLGLAETNATLASLTTDNVTFEKDVNILGNLYLSGNSYSVDTTTISYGDSFLSIAANNTVNDIIDLGLYGYYNNGDIISRSGLFRSSDSKDWFLFKDYSKEDPATKVDIEHGSFALANLRLATANVQTLLVNGSNIITTINSEVAALRANDYATYTTLSNSILSTISNINIISSKVENNSSNILVLQSNIISISSNLNTQASDILILQNNLIDANNAILNLQNSVAYSNIDIATLTSNIANLQVGLQGSNTNISNIVSDVSTLSNRVSNTEVDIALIQSSLPSYTSNISTLFSNTANLQVGLAGSNTNIDTVQSNLSTYSSYANATFVTLTNNSNTIQSNLVAYSTYANSTFVVLSNNSNTIQSNLVAYATYANSTFGTASGNVNAVQSNLTAYAAYANATFSAGGGVNQGASYVWTNTHTFSNTIIINAVSSNGSLGNPGQVLTSSGTDTYWADSSATGNVSITLSNATTQSFTGDGSNSNFTLNTSVGDQRNIIVSINGLVQIPSTHYTISGTTLSFTSPPYSSSVIEARNMEGVVVGGGSSSSISSSDLFIGSMLLGGM